MRVERANREMEDMMASTAVYGNYIAIAVRREWISRGKRGATPKDIRGVYISVYHVMVMTTSVFPLGIMAPVHALVGAEAGQGWRGRQTAE
jgi:hypothetical protein